MKIGQNVFSFYLEPNRQNVGPEEEFLLQVTHTQHWGTAAEWSKALLCIDKINQDHKRSHVGPPASAILKDPTTLPHSLS